MCLYVYVFRFNYFVYNSTNKDDNLHSKLYAIYVPNENYMRLCIFDCRKTCALFKGIVLVFVIIFQ